MQKIFCHKYCFFVLFMKVTESLLVKKSVLGNYLFWRDTSCLIYFSLLSHFIYLFTYAFIHSLILHVCAWVHACHSTCMEIKKSCEIYHVSTLGLNLGCHARGLNWWAFSPTLVLFLSMIMYTLNAFYGYAKLWHQILSVFTDSCF